MSDLNSGVFFADVKAKAVFGADHPRPQFLLDAPQYKALVVGLQAGQRIPPHPEEPAMYHFLEGEGFMTVGEETFAIRPGVTVVASGGVSRGIEAKTKMIFLASKGE